MINIPDLFGCNVFNDNVMRDRLSPEVYAKFHELVDAEQSLDKHLAAPIAAAMKNWAIEKGATHFTHWFQPMTGITAEKHDSFISPSGKDGVIMEFSGKELIKGESDASSFPSGGLRSTFEARGYTAWDPTCPAFVKDGTLCIPTVFCSYSGEVLDMKSPLLRSMEALNKQALRILKLFGVTDAGRVIPTVGPEQEYFLVDRRMFDKRPDLVFCGRTLFGAKSPKGQELEDHYFGVIKPRVLEFMKDLDRELWMLGIYAKTEHNEVAPSQHELAPIYTTVNIASDHNQLTMELMKKVAQRHGMVCLLHEKPFAGVNGSGKHDNWSLTTDTGINLLNPGKTPYENAQFLLFLAAVIKAVDDYQDLLRASVASAGNDHRLGANEAPPAIISMFLGDELEAILDAIQNGESYGGTHKQRMEIGVHTLPTFSKDTTDRNRTSPFAFTGNKFEFRSLGSSMNIAGPNIVLDTIVAESLRQFADELESAEDFNSALSQLIRRTITKHRRIIFSGNGYSDDWVKEAERRGLHNISSSVEAFKCYTSPESIRLFATHGVFSEAELTSRRDIYCDNYTKVIRIEAMTMIDMVKRSVVPAVSRYASELAANAAVLMTLNPAVDVGMQTSLVSEITDLSSEMYRKLAALEAAVASDDSNNDESLVEQAEYFREEVFMKMQDLRETVDRLESLVAADVWPFPTYGDILFSIQ